MINIDTVNDALFKAFKDTARDGIGCIVYVFDTGTEKGTGFNSENCTVEDALVMMRRLSERFDIGCAILDAQR